MKKIIILLLFCALSLSANEGPMGHAPINIMGDHTHKNDEKMLSYRYMRMEMDGLKDGSSDISRSDILEEYMMAPIDMTGEMHMLGYMWGLSDDITTMLMLSYQQKEMTMQMRSGRKMHMDSEGFGDVKAMMLINIDKTPSQSYHATLGVSIPTGKIDEENDNGNHLPYPMQQGSGTLDTITGLTWSQLNDGWSWGTQGMVTFRWGQNHRGYRLGDRLDASVWMSKEINEAISTSLGMSVSSWSSIDGQDSRILRNTPLADPNQSGSRIDISLGINILSHVSWLKDHRFALAVGTPIFESFDTPQMSTSWWLTVGWQKAFI